MNRHQVLTGACNFGDKCHAVGSVEGIHFTVYAAGCDIVILASDFQRVQIIPGVTHGNVKVSCIDASTDSGKIVASYLKKVYIFEPAPLVHHDSTHKLDYHWYQTAMFEADCIVHCLAWNLEGTKLLTGGEVIQLWNVSQEVQEDHGTERSVKFSLGQSDLGHDKGQGHILQPEHVPNNVWETIWKCKPATPVHHLQFSPDSLLFATVGANDRLVKIWYEDRKIQLPLSHADSVVSPKKEDLHFSFVYISHPRAVTGLSWRRTSKYMPRGSVANMLITSCKDNVCRIWSETILPDDGLVDLEQFDPNASFDPKFHTHRHKKRFMQRLKTIRHAIHKRKRHSKFGTDTLMSMPNMANIMSVHDFHKFSIHQNGVVPSLHFHLAASVNPDTDIPLLPVVGHRSGLEYNFQLHWLNNKELQFTMESEKILQEMHKYGVYDEQQDTTDNQTDSQSDFDSDHYNDYNEGPRENGMPDKKKKKSKKKKSKSRVSSDILGYHSDSNSSVNSDHSNPNSMSSPASSDIPGSFLDSLDRKIEDLLKDWHQNADMLFSIHPVDGSFLVWHVDWLDEYTPFSFRQAQVSFSSRLPHAFPVPDARSAATNLLMYCNYSKMDVKSAMKMSENDLKMDARIKQPSAATGKSSPGRNDDMLIPNVLMISKHDNGSLNQWQISFNEDSKFKNVVSVAHVSRACGHRFRTNSATCHPALPLLITTSQHNTQKNVQMGEENEEFEQYIDKYGFVYCSELILWRVDPVGPLSKSGGIVELAKINSNSRFAFRNVAWVPTLLPSTILGPYSNSPSTLFVASDGECLRLYQAVIDARSLLMEVNTRKESMSFASMTSSGYSADVQQVPAELFNIVSVQSSARPGCIIELDPFTDAQQMWQQTQILHVFQEQLVTGKSSHRGDNNNMDPIVDLRSLGTFEETFYLVVLEKNADGGSMLHMWKIIISSSQPSGTSAENSSSSKRFMMDYDIVDEDGSNPPSRSGSPDPDTGRATTMAKLLVSTTKVSCETLSLPQGVEVLSANVAAGHLSSASIYPACLAPYLLVTTCSDGYTRLWKCSVSTVQDQLVSLGVNRGPEFLTKSFEYGIEEEDGIKKPRRRQSVYKPTQDSIYRWTEWHPMYQDCKPDSIHIPGKPITVSCAYTGRIAIAYRSKGKRSHPSSTNSKFFNLCVAIFECESTGGCEWIKEDTIELKNIQIPDLQVEVDLDLSPDPSLTQNDPEGSQSLTPASNLISMGRTKSVPSLTALYCAKKELEENEDKTDVLRQKHLVQLDWVSTEDGSHVLTVGVGSKIMMYAQVSNEMVQESQAGKQPEPAAKRKISIGDQGAKVGDILNRRARLQKSKSMVVEEYQEVLQWMKLRCIDLTTADGLPPLPMHLSWVRGGILVVGMDNEMHVYSQWRWSQSNLDMASIEKPEDNDIRDIDDMNLMTIDLQKDSVFQKNKSFSSIKSSFSVPNFKRFASNVFRRESKVKTSTNLRMNEKSKMSLERSESSVSLTVIHELGLFEAARQANPVLPQYHPKSLMELLNFGKVKRVKAILAHLVRCIAGKEVSRVTNVDDVNLDDAHLYRQRTVSMATSPGEAPRLNEEPQLDYVEITSIPLLPLYALLSADNEISQADITVHSNQPGSATKSTDYNDLFQSNVFEEEELDINVLSSSADNKPLLNRTISSSGAGNQTNPYHFGSSQAQLLCKHLTHMHLPGLSGLDQMYLLALADTVAQTKTDFADSFDPSGGRVVKEGLSNQPAESLDDCGLRFLLAMRHHYYLMRSLPPAQRIQLVKHGLKSFNLVWAFHSEATEELLSLIPTKGELMWQDMKINGAGWWVNNINILKRTVEKIAKGAFQKRKDPMDAALFYLAMKKKNVLWGLFRSVENKRMSDFFRNDFSQDRWRKAALKNAFDLLGKQRFEHAAGFFLLAGSLNDAIEVILDKLHDIQLALVVCRLFDGEDMMCEPAKKILYTHVLGCEADGSKFNTQKAHPDPFLRSMTYWLFKDYRSALQTLLLKDIGGHGDRHGDAETFAISNVFNFYNYLRTHPLLIRHRIATAAPELKNKHVITGFTKQQTIVGDPEDEVASFVDRVTPMERRLFFATAHAHYKNGCPVLALEVLSKLPVVTESNEDLENETNVSKSESDACISTGNISDFSDTGNVQHSGTNSTIDWSTPVSNQTKQTADTFDWSQPVTKNDTAGMLDWSQPVSRFQEEELKLEFSSSESDEEEEEDDKTKIQNVAISGNVPDIIVENGVNGAINTADGSAKVSDKKSKLHEVDIFAQQYKFIACLKVMMEEMQTLATGFEVDGGQLRFQVYIWLEREVEALRMLCNYGDDEDQGAEDKTIMNDGAGWSLLGPISYSNICFTKCPDGPCLLDSHSYNQLVQQITGQYEDEDDLSMMQRKPSTRSDSSINKPTLHEVIMAEKLDLDAKMERMGQRKQWLRQNQQLLRTLVAYCVLQGAGGGGVASVQMELLLLLQELQQEKPQQQLLSPLPFPTTLPLLSAAIASSKTVTADPIQHIQCLCQDLLHSVIEFTSPPGLGNQLQTVLVMRNLSIALASCVYQCLCDSDSQVVSQFENVDVGFEGFFSGQNFVCDASHLMAGVRKHRTRSVTSTDDIINTSPGKWPGVSSLRVLLAREKDEDAPKLNILLTETLVSVYVSLLINALATYDCFLLYRLTAHKFDQQTWSSLFGGGVKSVIKIGGSSPKLNRKGPGDEMYNKRLQLNMKIIGQNRPDGRKTYKEKFVPPELSMISYFLTKPFVESQSDSMFSYDSDDSMSEEEVEEEDDFDGDLNRPFTLPLNNVNQHTDPSSYAWCLIRYSIVKLVLHNLTTFLPQIGIEMQELPVCSPLLHAVLRTMEQWEEILHERLDMFAAPPDNFIPGVELDIVAGMPNTKYKALLNKTNSPFIESHATLPIKRLWFHLLKQAYLRDLFVRYVFKKQKLDQHDIEDSSIDGTESMKVSEPMKIIHKEQDIITAFAINQANANCLTLATQKELIELDIHNILNPPVWLEDENEMDIEAFNNPAPSNPMENVDFLVVQTPSDQPGNLAGSGSNTPMTNQSSAASTPTVHLAPGQMSLMGQTGRGSSVVCRRPMSGVRRISAHPSLPHYLTGNTDGSVRLWEWGHIHPLAMLRPPGSFPKVTKVLFNDHGNKCCVSDSEGDICLWQVGHGNNFNKPIMRLKCHNKTTSDFVFVGSSSLIATAGHSSENRNVCLYDTLLPQRSACVHAFTCHEHGSPALVYAPHHQQLITGGRKGEICIFDIRQRQMRHTFQAHESLIRCLAIDPEEEYFVTGSADGDVKVWGLDVHQLVVAFQGEHTRSNAFFRSVGSASGVTQVAIGPKHHLFSCGVDGSMKFRALPERESIIRYWHT